MKTIIIGFNHGDFISTWYSSYLEISDTLVCSISLAPLLHYKFFLFSSSDGPFCIVLTTIWVHIFWLMRKSLLHSSESWEATCYTRQPDASNHLGLTSVSTRIVCGSELLSDHFGPD